MKLPRDKKSNVEPNITTKGVQSFKTNHQRGGLGTPTHEKNFRAEGTGRGRGGINPSPGTRVKGFRNDIARGLHALRHKASADMNNIIMNKTTKHLKGLFILLRLFPSYSLFLFVF